MKSVSAIVIILIMFSSHVSAAENNYKYCSIAGFFYGKNDDFMGGLASFIVNKKKLLGDSVCSAAWQSAFKVGKYFSKNGQYKNENDKLLGLQAGYFSDEVYESIIKNMKL